MILNRTWCSLTFYGEFFNKTRVEIEGFWLVLNPENRENRFCKLLWFSNTNVNSWPPILNEHHVHPIVKIITCDWIIEKRQNRQSWHPIVKIITLDWKSTKSSHSIEKCQNHHVRSQIITYVMFIDDWMSTLISWQNRLSSFSTKQNL